MIRVIWTNNYSTKQCGIGITKYFTVFVDYFKDIETSHCSICFHIWKFVMSFQLNKENTHAKEELKKAIKEQECYDAPAQG